MSPIPKAGISSSMLLELLRVHLAVHGEFVTTALLARAYEEHERVCESASLRRQDALNTLPDSSPDVTDYIEDIVRLRLEGTNSSQRACQLSIPVGLDCLMPKLRDIARERRLAARLRAGDSVLMVGPRSEQ